MPHGQKLLANSLVSPPYCSRRVVSPECYLQPFGIPLSQLLQSNRSHGSNFTFSNGRGHKRTRQEVRLRRRDVERKEFHTLETHKQGDNRDLHNINDHGKNTRIQANYRRPLLSNATLSSKGDRVQFRSLNTLLPNSSNAEKQKHSTSRRQPSKIVISGARARQPDKHSLIDPFPETPEQEKARLIEIERQYEQHVLEPLRRLSRLCEQLPRIDSDAGKEKINLALVQGRSDGIAKYHEYVDQQRQRRRQQRIDESLERFQNNTFDPLSRRLDAVFAGYKILEHEWKDLKDLVNYNVREEVRRLTDDALKIESSLDRMKSDEGVHTKMRHIINSLRSNTLAIAEELSPGRLQDLRLQLIRKSRSQSDDAEKSLNSLNPIPDLKVRYLSQLNSLNQVSRRALKTINFLRHDFIEFGNFLPAEGHRWRHLDVAARLTAELPTVFWWNRRFAGQYIQTSRSISTAESIYAHLLFLRGALPHNQSQTQTGNTISEATETAHKMLLLSREFHQLYEVAFSRGLSLSMSHHPNGFEQIQVIKFQPFVDLILQLKDLKSEIGHLLLFERMNHSRNDAGRLTQFNLISIIDDMDQKFDSCLRDFWQALNKVILWTGANDISTAIMYPRRRHVFHSVIQRRSESPERILARPKEKVKLPMSQTSSWLETASLYPAKQSIEIQFIVSEAAASEALRKLAQSKLIAVDAIIGSDDASRSSTVRSRIELLTFACDDRILILHLPTLSRNILRNFIPYLRDILQSNSILKAGMNIQQITEMLANQHLLYLENCYDIVRDNEQLNRQNNPKETRSDALSILSYKIFGQKMSDLFEIKQIRSFGVDDPQQYFHYLASRAYMMLQAFKATFGIYSNLGARDSKKNHQNKTTSDGKPPVAELDNVELGPVHIDPYLTSQTISDRRDRVRYSKLARGRERYLKEMSLTLARKALVKLLKSKSVSRRSRTLIQKRFLPSLQAYYLSTVFGENSEIIRKYLRLVIPPASILSIAHIGRLPIHVWHRDELLAERTGMIKAQGRIRAKMLFNPANVMAFELTERDKRLGRQSLTTYCIFHSFNLSVDVTAAILELSKSEALSDLISSKTYLIANEMAYDERLDDLVSTLTASLSSKGSVKDWQRQYDVLLPFGSGGLSFLRAEPKTVEPDVGWAETASVDEQRQFIQDSSSTDGISPGTALNAGEFSDSPQTSTRQVNQQMPEQTHVDEIMSEAASSRAKTQRIQRFLRRDSRRSVRRRMTDKKTRRLIASSLGRISRSPTLQGTRKRSIMQKMSSKLNGERA